MGRLFLLLVLIPLVDIYVLTLINGQIGFLNTLALVIATGLLGAWFVRLEGRRVWHGYTRALAEGRMPEEGFLGGVLLLLGGALLIAPGVLTDLVGIVLLVPWSRRRLARLLQPSLMRRIQRGARGGTIRIVTVGDARVDPLGETFGVFGPSFSREQPPPRHEPMRAEVVGRRVPVKRPPKRAVIDADFEVVDESS